MYVLKIHLWKVLLDVKMIFKDLFFIIIFLLLSLEILYAINSLKVEQFFIAEQKVIERFL